MNDVPNLKDFDARLRDEAHQHIGALPRSVWNDDPDRSGRVALSVSRAKGEARDSQRRRRGEQHVAA